jgi:hypothetical protein
MATPIKHWATISLQTNELQDVSFEKLAAAPASYAGRFYFDTVLNKFGYFDGSTWIYLGAAASQFKGNYDASIPGTLPGNGTTTLAGDFWIVSVAGTQIGIIGDDDLVVGDILYANVANANQVATNYFSVQTNISFATIANAAIGTQTTTAITPANLKFVMDAQGHTSLFGDGASLTYTITHNLNTINVHTEVMIVATGETTTARVLRATANTLTIETNPAPAANALRVLVRKIQF